MHSRAIRRVRRERGQGWRCSRRGAQLCRRAEGAVPREQAHAGAQGRVHREEQQDGAPGARLPRARPRGAHAEHAEVRHQAQGWLGRDDAARGPEAREPVRAAALAGFAPRGPGPDVVPVVPVIRRQRRRRGRGREGDGKRTPGGLVAVPPVDRSRASRGGDGCARRRGGGCGSRGRGSHGAAPRARRRRRGGACVAVRRDVTRDEGDQGEGCHRYPRALRLLRRSG
mmetsp:Transcript_9220/g.37700  ORF Transcript_9220/g.37700 Transcript_9220/m.37700 type:complete len:227 (+) Transcript_9220:502-1182(+)